MIENNIKAKFVSLKEMYKILARLIKTQITLGIKRICHYIKQIFNK